MSFFYDLLQYEFLQLAFFAGIAVSVLGGVIGTYITLKRLSYIAGAISHSVLAGMGLFIFLHYKTGIAFFTPLNGALLAALISAGITGWTVLWGKEKSDTVLSALWSVGMALGILFVYITPGYKENLMSYMFGNILLVQKSDLIAVLVLDAVVLILVFLFYNRIYAVALDDEFAELRGLNVKMYQLVFILFTAVTIVFLVQIAGIVMVISLLTLPAATASLFSRNYGVTMVLAFFLSVLFTTGGLVISYEPDLPSGAVIIIFSGLIYLTSFITVRKIIPAFRRKRLIGND